MHKLIAFQTELIRVDDIAHFSYRDEKKRIVRRRGMSFYVRYEDPDSKTGYLAPFQISNKTDGTWLSGAIEAGHIYVTALDHKATLPKKKSDKQS